MEKAPSDEMNHWAAVEAFLLDDVDQPTEEQYIELVIDRCLTNEPASRTAALAYASEHISDPELLISVKLAVAEKALDNIKSPIRTKPKYMVDGNRDDMDQATTLVAEVLDSPDLLPEGAHAQTYAVLKKMREQYWMCYDSNSQETYDHSVEILGLADRLLERTTQETGQWGEAIGSRLPAKRLAWAKWLRGCAVPQPKKAASSRRGRPALVRTQEIVNDWLDKAVGEVNTDYGDAADFCVNLYKNTWQYEISSSINGNGAREEELVDLKYPRRTELLDKALEVTASSDREPGRKAVKSRFGFQRTKLTPSPFERNRTRLKNFVNEQEQFDDLFENRPDFIARVIDLFDDDPLGQRGFQEQCSSKIAARAFTNGHYDSQAIQSASQDLARFGKIVPPEVVAETREAIKQRLADSTPASQ